MKQAESIISRVLKYGTLLSTYGLIGTVSLQIFARFFLAQAPSWTEEASRLFFIYSISFAAGLALKNRYYVHLDVVYEKLSDQHKKWMDLGIPILILMLFAAITVFSIELVVLGYAETSPSMGLKMAVPFLSMTIMAGSLSYYAALEIKKALNKLRS